VIIGWIIKMNVISDFKKQISIPDSINSIKPDFSSLSEKSIKTEILNDKIDLNSSNEEKELTILFYMNGQYGDRVSYSIARSMLDLEKACSGKDINIITQLGRKNFNFPGREYLQPIDNDWEGVRRYEVKNTNHTDHYINGIQLNSPEQNTFRSMILQDLGKEENMGEASGLQSFIEFGMEKYPAKHYIIVVMSHGRSWIGASNISPNEMKNAIENGVAESNYKTGRKDKIDILAFNACYMGGLEAASELKEVADISLLSENYALADIDSNWGTFIKNIQKDFDSGKLFEPYNFAYDYVERYKDGSMAVDHYPKEYVKYPYLTLTAVDNKKMSSLEDSWKKFLKVCKENGLTDKQLFTAIKQSKNYPSDNNLLGFFDQIRDLGSILDNVKDSDEISVAVKNAAEEVKKCLEDAKINEQHNGEGMEGSQGLTIWAPAGYADYLILKDRYPECVPEFLNKTGWKDRLDEASEHISQEVKDKCQNAVRDLKPLLCKRFNDKDLSPQEIIDVKHQLEEKKREDSDKIKEAIELSDFSK
jgi:hypothetical protein